jgi:endonuclease-8
MPEGPTIHRIVRDQTPLLVGKKVAVSSPQGRFADGAKLLDGQKLQRIDAWGKHLLYHFAGGRVLQIHLGLYGKFHVHEGPPPEPRGSVRMRMRAGRHTIDLNGPNQCRVIDESAVAELLDRIGPDPLNPRSDPAAAWEKIRNSRVPIGQLVMDQSVMSGIGNIYRAELLWMIRLHPRTPGAMMTKREFGTFWKLTQKWMAIGVEHRHIITVDSKMLPPDALKRGSRQRFNIYKHDTCPRCGAAIETYTLAGRTVWACAGCQVERKKG